MEVHACEKCSHKLLWLSFFEPLAVVWMTEHFFFLCIFENAFKWFHFSTPGQRSSLLHSSVFIQQAFNGDQRTLATQSRWQDMSLTHAGTRCILFSFCYFSLGDFKLYQFLSFSFGSPRPMRLKIGSIVLKWLNAYCVVFTCTRTFVSSH